MAKRQEAGWSSRWAENHGAPEPEQVYEAPEDQENEPVVQPTRFDQHVQTKDDNPELAMALALSWQRAGRQHFIRMLCCAVLSFIPMLWWLRWPMVGFGIAWIYCSYRFWTMKLT